MKVISPIQILPSMVTINNVAGSTLNNWSSGSTYAYGSEVQATSSDGSLHEYQWLPPNKDNISATSAYPPATHSVLNRTSMKYTDDDTDALYRCYWLDKGPVNNQAMFSQRSRRPTTNTGSIEAEVEPGEFFNSLALINLNGDSVDIEINDPEFDEVFTHSVGLMDFSNVYDEYTWCFAPIRKKNEVLLTDLPVYMNAGIKVTVSNPGETAQLGEFVVGLASDIGGLLYGVEFTHYDYSTNETDDQGYTYVSVGSYSRVVNYPLTVNTADLNYIQQIIAGLRATPAVYIGLDDRPETVVYGVCSDFSEVLSGPVKSDCNLKVKEISL